MSETTVDDLLDAAEEVIPIARQQTPTLETQSKVSSRTRARQEKAAEEETKKPASDSPFSVRPAMPKAGVIKRGVADIYITIGALLTPIDPVCGSALIESSENVGEALEELAKADPRVRRALMSLLQTSAYGGVIAAHAPIIMAIAAHHFIKKNGENTISGTPVED